MAAKKEAEENRKKAKKNLIPGVATYIASPAVTELVSSSARVTSVRSENHVWSISVLIGTQIFLYDKKAMTNCFKKQCLGDTCRLCSTKTQRNAAPPRTTPQLPMSHSTKMQ